jgi:hypothetical protein
MTVSNGTEIPLTPNRILSEPATVAACASERRTSGEQKTAAGAARDQLAFTRMAASGGGR